MLSLPCCQTAVNKPLTPDPILLVEDDAKLGRELRKALQREGFDCLLATTGSEALQHLSGSACALILLDWMLPDTEGSVLLAKIRKTHPRLPVLMLTARDAVEDRILGLDSGADDYLPKPFALGELLARIRRLLHRATPGVNHNSAIGGLQIDLLRRSAEGPCGPIDLTPREFDVLALLVAMQGETVSRQTLARDFWKQENRYTPLDNVIDVHLAKLRRKLRESLGCDPVETVRGVGFRIRL